MKRNYILTLILVCFITLLSKAQFFDIHNFDTIYGRTPYGSLTPSGNVLYGMTNFGGVKDTGCIFKINNNGSGYKDLFDFNVINGANPIGELTLSANKLYGMASSGGTQGHGVIFSIDTNGYNFKKLIDFNDTNGAYPVRSLTLSGSTLYGMTYDGGNGNGVIFSIDTNGNNYKKLHDFNDTAGAAPNGTLIIHGNVLYGVAEYGGSKGYGVVFSINTNGTGYKDLHDFTGSKGMYPWGTLAQSGNKLFGVTQPGSSSNDGSLFVIDTNGNGFKDLYDFTNSSSYPAASVILSGRTLYGMTEYGGPTGDGIIYSIDTNGSGYKNLLDFNGTNGRTPTGPLVFVGNVLYGMASIGGANNDGVIFGFIPQVPSICMVSVDTASTHNVIVWNTSGLKDIDSLKIYYLNSSSVWQLIKEVPFLGPNYLVDSTPVNNPNSNTVRYCLTSVDSNGLEESILASPWQNTMHINQSPAGTFTWSSTGYLKEGVSFPVLTYYLFRDSISNGNWKAIDSISGTQYTMSDNQYQAHPSNYPLARWYVGAKLSDSVNTGCTVPLLRPQNTNSLLARSNTRLNVNTSINQIDNTDGSISIYPNPAKQTLNIQFSNSETAKIKFIDVTGRLLLETDNLETSPDKTLQFNTSGLPAGIYFVQVLTNTSSRVMKFIKQ